jgi:probable F420-dependent oxidoreductase
MELNGVGVWEWGFRGDDRGAIGDAVAELEQLGYSAIWFPGSSGGPVFEIAETLLAATREVPVASGILNVWAHEPAEAAAGHARMNAEHGGRFLLGLGVGHPHQRPGEWGRPLTTMRQYLDALDAADTSVAEEERCLAALGPRMLELARDRSAGAHPYFVPVEHTRRARETLGPDALLAPEQAVVLETDPGRAREAGREHTTSYLKSPNYANNLRRLGYDDDDLAGGGSDRLIDALVAWGDLDAIRARIEEHRDAGADHVCIQVLPRGDRLPRAEWRELAPALVGV